MYDPEESDLSRDVEASMRMFKKAQVGPLAKIEPATPQRLLLTLDGSEQDETSIEAASYFQRRFQSQIWVLDAREDRPTASELAEKTGARLAGAQLSQRSDGPAYDAILHAAAKLQPDLVILPCPFQRDFESVGSDSAGTVIDVMLSRCRTAMLVIRRDDQPLDKATDNIAILIGSEVDNEKRAAAWAVGLAHPGTELSLDLVVDKEYYENIREIMEVLSPEKSLDIEQLSDAMADAHARLHGALAKTAAEAEWHYSFRPLAAPDAPPNASDAKQPLLIVMPLESDDRFGHGFVQDRIRRSPHPLIVVPSWAGHGGQGDEPA